MKPNRSKETVIPGQVSRTDFGRILGNLVNSAPLSRKDARIGKKKKAGTIIPPIQPPER